MAEMSESTVAQVPPTAETQSPNSRNWITLGGIGLIAGLGALALPRIENAIVRSFGVPGPERNMTFAWSSDLTDQSLKYPAKAWAEILSTAQLLQQHDQLKAEVLSSSSSVRNGSLTTNSFDTGWGTVQLELKDYGDGCSAYIKSPSGKVLIGIVGFSTEAMFFEGGGINIRKMITEMGMQAETEADRVRELVTKPADALAFVATEQIYRLKGREDCFVASVGNGACIAVIETTADLTRGAICFVSQAKWRGSDGWGQGPATPILDLSSLRAKLLVAKNQDPIAGSAIPG